MTTPFAVVGRGFCTMMVFLSLYCSTSEAAIINVKRMATTVLQLETIEDWAIATLFVLIGYVFQYLATSMLFEWTNPLHYDPNQKERLRMLNRQLELGLWMMFFNVFFAVSWMYFVEPYTPFFGYWQNRQFAFMDSLVQVVVYAFWFDSWFYWTHRILHANLAWKYIHHIHHQFVCPTAFAQDAVHPIEGIVQGPLGHFLLTLLFPMHPVLHVVLGFFTSVYAVAAHDGRTLDTNDHTKHHTHKNVNFGLYWGFWDYVCGTRYNMQEHGA